MRLGRCALALSPLLLAGYIYRKQTEPMTEEQKGSPTARVIRVAKAFSERKRFPPHHIRLAASSSCREYAEKAAAGSSKEARQNFRSTPVFKCEPSRENERACSRIVLAGNASSIRDPEVWDQIFKEGNYTRCNGPKGGPNVILAGVRDCPRTGQLRRF